MLPHKEDIKLLGLNPVKELITFLAGLLMILAVAVGVFLWVGATFLLILPAFLLLGYLFYYANRYGAMKARRQEEMMKEFVNLFTFFGIYVNDGLTIYGAFEKLRGFASETVDLLLQNLLSSIDEDKSVTPYIEFAKQYEDIAVKEVMMAVYQMVDEGQGGVYIRQFERLFGELSDTRHALDKEKRLARLDTLSFLPLCGAGIAMIALTLSILDIMGGFINVL